MLLPEPDMVHWQNKEGGLPDQGEKNEKEFHLS